MNDILFFLFTPLIIESVFAVIVLLIIIMIYMGMDIFFQKFICQPFNKIIYKHYKGIKLKIFGKYNDYFDDFVFFVFGISSLILAYSLFYTEEINGNYLKCRMYISNALIIFYWLKDIGTERHNREPSFEHIALFGVVSLLYTKIFMFFYFNILREYISQNTLGFSIFLFFKMLEVLIYSATYQYLKNRLRG